MALVVKDRVKETTATTGTGTVTLAGAVAGFQSFSAALSDADTTYYSIFESSTGAYEVGLGTFTLSGTTLSRDTILESSNAGSAINLTAGAADVFITYPAEKSVYLDGTGSVTSAAGQIDISDFNNDAGYSTTTGTVTSVAATAGTGISITGSPITASGTLTITNEAPDQTVVLTGGTGISTSGTYPSFTITNDAPDQTVVLTEGANITITGTYPSFTIASSDEFTGTVTSVGGTGTVNGISLSGTVTSSGNLTLGGTLSNVDLTTQITGTLPVANGGTGITSFGTGVATWLGTPSSANLAAAVTDETGSGALVFATSPTLVTPVLGTPTSGTLSNCTVDGTTEVGFLSIPQESKSADYTLVLADSGKHVLHPSADTTPRTFTIPANSSVAFPVGTAVTFINQDSAGEITIAITTDTMRLAGDGGTGSRTLASNGIATAVKVTSTEWIISGVGLT